jgi:hypothetical protein
MRSIFRIAALATAASSVLLLSGCIVAPPGYGPGYGGGGYYAPAPVVVAPSIGFWGHYGGGGRYWR